MSANVSPVFEVNAAYAHAHALLATLDTSVLAVGLLVDLAGDVRHVSFGRDGRNMISPRETVVRNADGSYECVGE